MKCQTAKQTSVTWTPEDWQLEKMEFNRKTFFFFGIGLRKGQSFVDVGIVMLFHVISGLDVAGFRSQIIFF